MVHTCVLPGFRGRTAIESGKAVTQWMFDHAGAIKIVSIVPAFNKAALSFGLKCGYEIEGIVKKAYVKDDRVYDFFIIGRGA